MNQRVSQKEVHAFVATGVHGSKFGVDQSELASLLEAIEAEPLAELVGLHCHIGSTIDNLMIFR